MKRIIALMLTFVMLLSFAACGNKEGKGEETTDGVTTDAVTDAPAVAVSPLEALNKVWATFADDEKFAAAGGDANNMSMDGPGKFAVEGEEAVLSLDSMLGFPQALVSQIDDAASLMHMMNANTFTCGAYHFKNAADATAAVETIKSNILARQWMCGFPETLIIVDLGGGTVLSAFGNGQIIELFKTKTLGAIEGSKVVVESPSE